MMILCQIKHIINKMSAILLKQVSKLLDFCDDRIRLIILLFASSGMRLAGLGGLKIRNLSKIKNENIYRITVYEGSKEEYITFCTPECTKAIASYLSYRERSGEKLDPNSPLIRNQFNADDLIHVKNPKDVTTSTIGKIIESKLRQAGLRQIEHATENKYASQIRKTIPMIHGFRKFFNTALMNSDVHPSFKKLLMGHSVQLDEVYYDKGSEKSRAKLLEEYCKAIDALTINEENRLKLENQQIKQRNETLEKDKDEIFLLRKELEPLLALKNTLIKEGVLKES
jgi:integrase